LLALVQLVGEGLLKQLIILQDGVNFHKAKHDALAHVSILVAHQETQDIGYLEEMLY
jgi:hypothetical protein